MTSGVVARRTRLAAVDREADPGFTCLWAARRSRTRNPIGGHEDDGEGDHRAF
jgi:hypothetical protein